MGTQQLSIFEIPITIRAGNAKIGKRYRTKTDIPVLVKSKQNGQVVLRSLATRHDVVVRADYPLFPLIKD